MDYIPINKQFGRISPFRFWCQKVLPAVYDDSLSYYELLCKVTETLNKVIELDNTQSDAITELQEILAAFMAGEFDPYIEQKVDEWFEKNEPKLMATIANLQQGLADVNQDLQKGIADVNQDLQQGLTNVNNLIEKTWHQNYDWDGKNLVILGDSYLAPGIPNSEYEWLAKKLSTNLNMPLFNYAYGGAGFGRSTNLISTQQTRATNEMTSSQKKNTGIVLCMAGCNDLLNLDSQSISQQDIVNGINSYINWACSTYPNAKVVLIPFNWGFSKLTYQILRLITNVISSISTTVHAHGVLVIEGAWLWNLGVPGRFRNEVHPNEYGYRVIYNKIVNALEGTSSSNYQVGYNITVNIPELTDNYVFYYNVINGVVYVHGYIRPVNAQVGMGSQITLKNPGNLPAIVTPNNSIICIPLISSTTGKQVGIMGFRNDGSAYIRFVDVQANEVCNFNYSYLAEVGVDLSDYTA